MGFFRNLRSLGPGLAIAATGVGAGDLLAAMVAGADFGVVVLWAIVLGAALKLALNEGVARWQLATGTSLMEGWCRHLGRPFRIYFLLYLVVWGFIVAGGLMSACGVAANALVPRLPIAAAGIGHSLVALALVLVGRYGLFESLMKWLIGLMVITLLASVALIGPDLGAALRGLVVPAVPVGSAAALLGLMGGVGGSVTMLAYGYWIAEKGWDGPERLSAVRTDLAVGYVLTGLFGVAMLMLAAEVLQDGGGLPRGSAGLVACADAIGEAATTRLGAGTGGTARTIFLVGVWGAIFTSTLGVWQGVPYLFADYIDAMRGKYDTKVDVRGRNYRGFLLYLALPPMVLLAFDRPIWVIRTYTIASGLFMPILAASLLWLNGRDKFVGRLRNRWLATTALVVALLLFGVITGRQVLDQLFK